MSDYMNFGYMVEILPTYASDKYIAREVLLVASTILVYI